MLVNRIGGRVHRGTVQVRAGKPSSAGGSPFATPKPTPAAPTAPSDRPKPAGGKPRPVSSGGSGKGASASASPAADAAVKAPRKDREPVPHKETILDRMMSESEASSTRKAIPLAVLKGGRHKMVKDGVTVVYEGAVDCVIGRPPPGPGAVVIVADGSRKPLAWGVFNPNSQYRIRIMQTAAEADRDPSLAADLPALLKKRIHDAVQLRKSLGLPGPLASVYRLVNSEGDRVSGLIADVLGDSIVVSSSAYYVQENQELITSLLKEATGLKTVVWRPATDVLQEEGWAAPAESSPAEGDEGEGETPVDLTSAPVVYEDGIKYYVNLRGQKTGFYADQRENRKFVRTIAGGKAKVADLCSYSGGFALNAFLGGAADVTGVDSSAEAVALATRNAELNGFDPSKIRFVKADVEEFMKQEIAKGTKYDLLVLDPPKLAPSRKTLDRALIKYKRLNSLALQLVPEGGILITCTCSGAMTQSTPETGGLGAVVKACADQAGRRLTSLRVGGAAACHVLDPNHNEGRYLEVLAFRVL